jgi:hypothetical protein
MARKESQPVAEHVGKGGLAGAALVADEADDLRHVTTIAM